MEQIRETGSIPHEQDEFLMAISISNIKQYWGVERYYQIYLLEIEKLTTKIDAMMDKRNKMDKANRKPLSDKIVDLEHDRARLQGKAMKMKKALDEYAKDYSKEPLSLRDLIPWNKTALWIVIGLACCAIGCFLLIWWG